MNTCETCGERIVDHTTVCGAPQCCPRCCKEAEQQECHTEVDIVRGQLNAALVELATLRKRLADARTISLPNVDGWFLLVAMNDGEIKEYIK